MPFLPPTLHCCDCLPVGIITGRVQRGTGLGRHFGTLMEPIPPQRVGGIPMGFYLQNWQTAHTKPLMELGYPTVQYQTRWLKIVSDT